jgi:thiol-disulfide isomerase/thioredoxin
MTRILIPVVLLVALAVPAAAADDKPKRGPVELKEVSIDALHKAISAQKGKVVVIDCWYLGCAPCKKKFPYMVGVHRKLASEGMVFMSLDLLTDDLAEKDQVLEFLKKQEADFPNFIFNDKQPAIDKWQEKYEAEAAPAIVVFNRKGEWVKVPDEVAKEKEPEKYAAKLTDWVKTLLAEK